MTIGPFAFTPKGRIEYGYKVISGASAKLDRAATLARELDKVVGAWLAKRAPALTLERQGAIYTWYPVERESPPAELSVRAGEIIQHLRSALDHTAWALAGEKATRATQFPLAIDASDFRKASGQMLRGIGGTAAALIEEVQPYQRTGDLRLLAVAAMSNLDKHRLLYASSLAVCLDAAMVEFRSKFHDLRGIKFKQGTMESAIDAIRAGERPWVAQVDVVSLTNPAALDLSAEVNLRPGLWDQRVMFRAKLGRTETFMPANEFNDLVKRVTALVSMFDVHLP